MQKIALIAYNGQLINLGGNMLALEGVRILDLSRLVPGAFCTMLLGDLGADVLKIEAPDTTKFMGSARSLKEEENRKQVAYYAPDRNKRSVVLNLKSKVGREIFYQLSRNADIIVEGFRPGVAQRLGINYETINKLNPKIIYC